MTRLFQRPNIMQAEIELRINQAYDKLKANSADELKAKFIEGFNYSTIKDRRGDKLGNWRLVVASPIFYEGIAAQKVLNERYGNDYCRKILGYHEPKTLKEKLNHWFLGKLPDLIYDINTLAYLFEI